jgi:hypothetical protein
VIVPYAGLWLLVSSRLPHRDAPWTALWPGALLLALFFISRLVVAAAGLNATLWERRVRGSSVGHPAAVDEQVRP